MFIRIPAWSIVQVGKLIGVSLEIQGLENINRNHGGVVFINQQSALDLIGEFAGKF
jgi:lysophosphatidate acyltransferase